MHCTRRTTGITCVAATISATVRSDSRGTIDQAVTLCDFRRIEWAVEGRAGRRSWNEWSFHDCCSAGFCSGKKQQLRVGGAPGARTQNPRIKSPRVCGSRRFGGVLTWASEPVWHLPDPGELQPELQPLPSGGGRDRAAQGGGAGPGAPSWQCRRGGRLVLLE